MWKINLFILLLLLQLCSACSIEMIAGSEQNTQTSNQQLNNSLLKILSPYRVQINIYENPRLSQQYAAENRAALNKLESTIRELNMSVNSIRHTLASERNDANFKFTDYINIWKIPLERYSNNFYLDGLNAQDLNGNVLVDVAITKLGKLYSYKIIRNSGSPDLARAVKNIIHQNLPFQPLNANIKIDTDVLHIAQMWQFQATDRNQKIFDQHVNTD